MFEHWHDDFIFSRCVPSVGSLLQGPLPRQRDPRTYSNKTDWVLLNTYFLGKINFALPSKLVPVQRRWNFLPSSSTRKPSVKTFDDLRLLYSPDSPLVFPSVGGGAERKGRSQDVQKKGRYGQTSRASCVSFIGPFRGEKRATLYYSLTPRVSSGTPVKVRKEKPQTVVRIFTVYFWWEWNKKSSCNSLYWILFYTGFIFSFFL